MTPFIIYQGRDETIITTPEEEANTVRLYFTEGGRNLEDYDRDEVTTEAVQVRTAGMLTSW